MPPLPRAVLERGITHMASAASVQRLMHRLQHGLPVSVGVLGASVGQLGGCLTQKGQRCMDTRFDQSTGLWHGGRNGYFARFFLNMNATWPHRHHQFYNGAVDATPAHMFAECLHSLLPSGRLPDLMLLEFGSMARSTNLPRTELLVRTLLALPTAPTILFFTVREWCPARKVRASATKPLPSYPINASTGEP